MRPTMNNVIPIDIQQRIHQEVKAGMSVRTGIPRTERLTRMPTEEQLLSNFLWLRRESNRQRVIDRKSR